MKQRRYNVIKTLFRCCLSGLEVVSTLCNVENPTSNFVSLSTSENVLSLLIHNVEATLIQRWNVASTLWINIETTLHRRWSKIWSRIFNVGQSWWKDVETTLKRYTTLLQRYRSYRFYQALELMVNESFKWFIAKKIDGCYSEQIFNELES